MKKILILSIAIIFSGMLFSCSDSVQPENSKFNNFMGVVQKYTGDYYTRDELKEMYNNGNLTGVIIFYKRYRNELTLTGGSSGNPEYTPYDGYTTDAEGIFFNPDTYEDMKLGAFELNAMAMRQYQDGHYTPYLDDIDIYMGGELNKWVIDPYNGFPGDSGEVAFANEIRITNIHRLDTIDISDTTGTNGLDLYWTGGSSFGKIQIKIEMKNMMYDTLDAETGIGMSLWIDNSTNNYHLFNRTLYTLIGVEGLYDITITYYEPHYATLSNGKQLLLIGESAHNITVYLKRNSVSS